MQHRLVMECKLGILIDRAYHVHHINEVKWDNRMENLELLLPGDHMRHHHFENYVHDFSDDEVLAALEGRTTLEAAQFLGCNHQTLRNRYEHLLDKRISPGSEYPQHVVDAVRRLAEDSTVSTREASRRLNMSQVTMRKVREQAGIGWTSAPRGNPNHRR